MKRTLIAVGVIAGVALVVFLGYYFRFRGEEGAVSESGSLGNGGLPLPPLSAGSGIPTGTTAGIPVGRVFGAVSDAPVSSFFADGKGGILFMQTDGQIMRVLGGKSEMLTTGTVLNLAGSSFSADGRYVLARLAEAGGEQWSVFDVEKKAWEILPQGARAAVWAPAGSTFAYVRESGGREEILIQDAASMKTAPQVASAIAFADPRLAWPAPGDVVIGEPASALSPSLLLRLNLKDRSLRTVASGRGISATWDGRLDRGLVFTASSLKRGGSLEIRKGDGTLDTRLNFITLPEKCLFGESVVSSTPPEASATGTVSSSAETATTTAPFLLCAVGRDVAALRNAMLPDSYDKGILFTADDFYRIDIATGDATLLSGTSGETIDVTRPAIAGDTLFFVNRIDRKLYALSLAPAP